MTRDLDLSPLTEPIDEREVDEFRERVRRDKRYRYWRLSFPIFSMIGLTVALFVLSGFFALMAALFLDGEADGIEGPGDVVGIIVALVFVLGIYVAIAAGLVELVRNPVQTEEVLRLHRFAERNGLRYTPLDEERPAYPVSPFGYTNTVVRDRFRPADGDAFDMGLAYKPKQNKNDPSIERWYLAISLTRELPHIVLDARSNDPKLGGSNMPTLDRGQVLSLEGDFDEHFTLYCPTGYEQDALYIFTPDLMALCIDEASAFDIEIIDRWLFVYAARPLRMSDPEVQRRVFRLIDVVGAKALGRMERYAEGRIAAGRTRVADPGRRLRTAVSVSAVVIGLVICSSPFWGVIVDALTGV
ncbi:hypothetical protein [Labedella endophytica]|uniref:DUF3137 domain-containing protein n=1 Tax=Labedella endophytica TaxID=1523160 RepID=A0A3S0X0K0_9MICO|nr:hypothetical protein [Labedella endophytica]RUR03048.1 hypothetical protein ELQ94_00325 [Labedella endophytica]